MNAETGWFYKRFIDPLLFSVRKNMAAEINSGETVLDIACGTGAFAFEAAKTAKKVVGIDLSQSMIKTAKKTQETHSIQNTEFMVADAARLDQFTNNQFDVVTLSMALHQFNPEIHSYILSELKRVANTILVVDYSVPLPKNILGYSSKLIEFLAGKEHNSNFRKYYKAGGLYGIFLQNEIGINKSKHFSGGIFHLIKCR